MIQLVRVAHRSVLELNTYRPGGAFCAAGNEHGAWIGLIDEESKLKSFGTISRRSSRRFPIKSGS